MLAREFPDLFFAFGSVNPYRKDSVKRLQHLSELGVNVIKWLVRREREREGLIYMYFVSPTQWVLILLMKELNHFIIK